jgi:enterochelin esterase family protein
VYDTRGDLGGDLTLLKLLVPGETWEVVADHLGFADALCSDADGHVYFSDMRAPAVYRINASDGARTEIATSRTARRSTAAS